MPGCPRIIRVMWRFVHTYDHPYNITMTFTATYGLGENVKILILWPFCRYLKQTHNLRHAKKAFPKIERGKGRAIFL
jgi:hypothetical protein